MSYEVIRQRLARCLEEDNQFSKNEKMLIEALHQLTIVLESDLTQIKVALGHIARLLEAQAD
jgi:flagellar motor switch protein FliM